MDDLGTGLAIETLDDGLSLCGEIDAHSAPALRVALEQCLSAGSGEVRLHMGGVGFMDSSGLRAVIEANHAALRDDRALVLVAPTPIVRRLIEVSGLVDHIAMRDAPD